MTNTEAFKEAKKLINEKLTNAIWDEQPMKVFLIPQRVIWLWLRIDDYYIVNKKWPTSYRTLHAWEKKYYENNM